MKEKRRKGKEKKEGRKKKYRKENGWMDLECLVPIKWKWF